MFCIGQIRTLAVLTAFIGINWGCSSTQQQNNMVTAALNSYQVGKTTLEDLKKDTGMALVGIPADPVIFPPKSYIFPQPFSIKLPDPMLYILPPGSPWKIYETRPKMEIFNGKTTRAWAFVIGDTNKPVCLIEFGFDNVLTNISPVQDFISQQAPKVSAEITANNRTDSLSKFLPPKAEANSHESPGPLNIEIVAQTLYSYQSGKTTIFDFVRDAKLINLFYPELNATGTNTNIAPVDLKRMVRSNYSVPNGSPWKIYGKGNSSSKPFGSFDFTVRWKFAVGDINKAICILSFDEKGILQEKVMLP